jgi:hypothetical protein
MATKKTADHFTGDERKLLGLPTGWERPTGKQLVELAIASGYKLRKNASRQSALDAIATGKYADRRKLQGEVREAMKVPADTPAKGEQARAGNGKATPTTAEMRAAIKAKGYTETLPRKAAEVKALHQSIVTDKVIPHQYETGTRLVDQLSVGYTILAVTPDKGTKVEQVEMSAKAQAKGTGVYRIRERANNRGQFVRFATEVVEAEPNVWAVTVELIPQAAE